MFTNFIDPNGHKIFHPWTHSTVFIGLIKIGYRMFYIFSDWSPRFFATRWKNPKLLSELPCFSYSILHDLKKYEVAKTCVIYLNMSMCLIASFKSQRTEKKWIILFYLKFLHCLFNCPAFWHKG